MYEIKCPVCGQKRSVRAKKPWMSGEPPFSKICKSCCQKGKEKTPEWRSKLSESIRILQTEEVLQKKSQFMKDHPEVWKENLIFGQSAGWNKGKKMPKTSDEIRKKISDSLKTTLRKKKDN